MKTSTHVRYHRVRKSFTENGKADSLLLAFSSPSTVADIELVEGGVLRLEWFSLRQKSKMR